MLNDQTFEAPAVAIPTQRANAAPMQRGTAFTQNRNGESNGAIVGFTAPQDRSIAALLPIMGVVSVAFLVIGFALPGWPLHVHHVVGLSIFLLGLVAVSQFAVALIAGV